MKKIFFYPFALVLGVLFFTACDKDRAFPEFGDEGVGLGAYPRLVGSINGNFDFENIDGSGINFAVEFYDVNQGRDVASYSWTATYGDLGPVPIVTINSSEFSSNSDGLPQATVDMAFSKILSAFGLDQSGIVPGQSFELNATLTMTDGRTFDANNTAAAIQGQPLYQGTFFIRQGVDNVPCFSKLAGTFDATATSQSVAAGIGWDDCDGNVWTGTVIWEAEHNPDVFGTGTYKMFSINDNGDTVEDASNGTYYGCYTGSLTDPSALPLGDVRINDDCETLFWTGASQWGEVYSFRSITVSGADLTFEWENDYGEAGKVKLTRTDGQDWPAALKF